MKLNKTTEMFLYLSELGFETDFKSSIETEYLTIKLGTSASMAVFVIKNVFMGIYIGNASADKYYFSCERGSNWVWKKTYWGIHNNIELDIKTLKFSEQIIERFKDET